MPPQQQRPSDIWNDVADDMLAAADMAAASADHYARLDLPVKALAERRAEEMARMQAKRCRERSRILRELEEANDREDAIDQDATTGKYKLRWVPLRPWWRRFWG